MDGARMTTRKIKAKVLALLRAEADPAEFEGLERTGLINGLLAALNRPEEEVRHRAGEVLGLAVAGLAGDDLEAARNIMRRLAWSLNDESGAVGWGAAEGMAEIMVRVPDLAREFSAVLVFQLREDPGAPEFPPLVKSCLRAVGRIAGADKNSAAGAAQHLPRFLRSPDPEIRGLAARTAGRTGAGELKAELARLFEDPDLIEIRIEGRMRKMRVEEVARIAYERLAAEEA